MLPAASLKELQLTEKKNQKLVIAYLKRRIGNPFIDKLVALSVAQLLKVNASIQTYANSQPVETACTPKGEDYCHINAIRRPILTMPSENVLFMIKRDIPCKIHEINLGKKTETVVQASMDSASDAIWKNQSLYLPSKSEDLQIFFWGG